ncbi:helix-turn-helix transcriptional regulator [Thermomonospora catenispora]|uniref:helix-turn-helix transcriptional regulator n=1 Tax=Thermomonospora catenispora TaxID=2493090 RepID=UPI001120F442|nr:AraC family transcriptional regulator [Thermomonospora catenispora]TNY38239.1 AraC family transcriptional regulator [Thermomonospora catenispora]
MAGGGRDPRIVAWRPRVHGIREVFHARFAAHAYPAHTHEAWTLLIVDSGAVEFALAHGRHVADRAGTVILPPAVSHDGRAATSAGFGKRVLYLDPELVPERLIGAAVDGPVLRDGRLRRWVHELHEALRRPGDEFEAESRLAVVGHRLRSHLATGAPPPEERGAARLAHDLRDLLDARVQGGVSLREAAQVLHAHPAHLVRCFTQTFGLPPHRYLTGRRIDRARRLLIEGRHPAEVATEVGFYDQAHMTRHFRRHFGVPPARYAATARRLRQSGSAEKS